MEIRKVQITGGSSYVITLPKEWIKANNVEKNHSLGLIVQPDGTLLVTSKIKGERKSTTKVFNVDSIEETTHFFRMLIGAYIMGYSAIEIKSKTAIQSLIRDCVIDFTQTVIGPEIIEEDMKYILIKDLLNPVEMPFEKTINRMFILTRSMQEDAVKAIETGNASLSDDVVVRDRDVDRLQWLIARQSNIILKDINFSKQMEVTLEEATYYFVISRIIERIGDHAVRIAKQIELLDLKRTDEELIDNISSASELALEIFSESIESWQKKDINKANENISMVSALIDMCNNINDSALKIKGPKAISVGYVTESIRRVGEYGGDISELAINQLVKD